jgi:hypothetical protein
MIGDKGSKAEEELQQLREAVRRLKLDDRFHESCHFGGIHSALWIPI